MKCRMLDTSSNCLGLLSWENLSHKSWSWITKEQVIRTSRIRTSKIRIRTRKFFLFLIKERRTSLLINLWTISKPGTKPVRMKISLFIYHQWSLQIARTVRFCMFHTWEILHLFTTPLRRFVDNFLSEKVYIGHFLYCFRAGPSRIQLIQAILVTSTCPGFNSFLPLILLKKFSGV